MTIVNKTERKKLVGTQVVGDVVVFMRVDTGEEIGRLDTSALTTDMQRATLTYGTKQIISDIGAGTDDIETRIATMQRGIASLGSGSWPRRESAPASMEKAIITMMATLGETREQILARLDIVE
jgi:hypothetical protein